MMRIVIDVYLMFAQEEEVVAAVEEVVVVMEVVTATTMDLEVNCALSFPLYRFNLLLACFYNVALSSV